MRTVVCVLVAALVLVASVQSKPMPRAGRGAADGRANVNIPVDEGVAHANNNNNNNNNKRDPGSWDYNTALYYLMYAYGAYCPPNSVADWSCKYCGANGTSAFQIYGTYSNASTYTFAFTGHDSSTEQIIVSFRGTVSTSIEDWVLDLKSAESHADPRCSGCQIADGFDDAYMSLRAQMLPDVQKLLELYPSYDLYITGHSLGAAMAVVAAADYHTALGAKVNLWNFGQPRVGNDAWHTWFGSYVGVSWRQTNQKDIVPHVPLEIEGYHHIATEVWRNLDQQYVVCDGSGEDDSCSDSVTFALSVYDHLHYLSVPLTCSPTGSSSSSSAPYSGSSYKPTSSFSAGSWSGSYSGSGKSSSSSSWAAPQRPNSPMYSSSGGSWANNNNNNKHAGYNNNNNNNPMYSSSGGSWAQQQQQQQPGTPAYSSSGGSWVGGAKHAGSNNNANNNNNNNNNNNGNGNNPMYSSSGGSWAVPGAPAYSSGGSWFAGKQNNNNNNNNNNVPVNGQPQYSSGGSWAAENNAILGLRRGRN